MEKYAKIFIALLLAASVCSCTRIPDYSAPEDDGSESSDSASSDSAENPEYLVSEFAVEKQDYAAKLNAEGGVFDGGELIEGEDNGQFDGKGFVRLKQGGSLSHVVTAGTPQHYRVMIAARSETGASLTFSRSDVTQGAYYVPPLGSDERGGKEYNFEYYAVDNVYLTAGANTLKFTVESGTVDIDYLFVESSGAVKSSCYSVGNACVNPVASLKSFDLMQYFSNVYGKKTLTAQNVTVGTNAEIDAVYKQTGRYPAIRVGELAPALLKVEESVEKAAKDIELAAEWSREGGIVAYTWHWYSPNSLHGTAPRDFSLDKLFEGQDAAEIAGFTEGDIKALLENGYISEELVALLNDIDKIAALLGELNKQDIPVIFEPIPDADTGIYWWGNGAEDYKKLWRIVFDRLCLVHNLKNIIWVWNGSDIDYYPGDRYVDIIGQSFYEGSKSSFAGRFSAISEMDTARKIQTVTACDVLPSIDYMYRDNAMWLWAAVGSGQCVINDYGVFVETYNSRSALNHFYNHELTVTRDELNITH